MYRREPLLPLPTNLSVWAEALLRGLGEEPGKPPSVFPSKQTIPLEDLSQDLYLSDSDTDSKGLSPTTRESISVSSESMDTTLSDSDTPTNGDSENTG